MADEQHGLIVELRTMRARAGQELLGDLGQRTVGVRGEHFPRPGQPELAILRVEHFEEAVGHEREQVARLPVDRLRVEAKVRRPLRKRAQKRPAGITPEKRTLSVSGVERPLAMTSMRKPKLEKVTPMASQRAINWRGGSTWASAAIEP